MLGWLLIAAVFWIAGAFAEHGLRLALWSVAVLCEYVSPMIGFALPGVCATRQALSRRCSDAMCRRRSRERSISAPASKGSAIRAVLPS